MIVPECPFQNLIHARRKRRERARRAPDAFNELKIKAAGAILQQV